MIEDVGVEWGATVSMIGLWPIRRCMCLYQGKAFLVLSREIRISLNPQHTEMYDIPHILNIFNPFIILSSLLDSISPTPVANILLR